MGKYYQDLKAVGDDSKARMDFVYTAIQSHKASDEYQIAKTADDYASHKNTTIIQYQKVLYTLSGNTVPDNISANYKLCSNFFDRFITQLNQYLLGNGITFADETTADKLGDDFDYKVQDAGYGALCGGTSFGFWNFDHLEVFTLTDFAPLYDENNGALMAGIRWWQIEEGKPLRAILYEIDGITEYAWNRRENDEGVVDYYGEIVTDKHPYKLKTVSTVADGMKIYDGENYETFPIVPLYANRYKQSELVGLRENIDCYDLIKSGFANDLDDASQIYWTITNAGGMDDIDLTKFIERLKTVKATTLDHQEQVQPHTIDVPYAGREAILERLRADMYDDFMALDTKEIAGGAITATQIQASYEPLNQKTDKYEYQVTKFIKGILAIIGIDDMPTYTRSTIVNKSEEIGLVLQSAMFLTPEYCTTKILTLLGDADQVDDVLNEIQKIQTQQTEAEQIEEEPTEEEIEEKTTEEIEV